MIFFPLPIIIDFVFCNREIIFDLMEFHPEDDLRLNYRNDNCLIILSHSIWPLNMYSTLHKLQIVHLDCKHWRWRHNKMSRPKSTKKEKKPWKIQNSTKENTYLTTAVPLGMPQEEAEEESERIQNRDTEIKNKCRRVGREIQMNPINLNSHSSSPKSMKRPFPSSPADLRLKNSWAHMAINLPIFTRGSPVNSSNTWVKSVQWFEPVTGAC